MRRSFILTVLILLVLTSFVFSADKYVIDVAHSSVGFSVRHLVISNIKGKFKDFSGTIMLDSEDISKSSVNITIKTASIDTDDEKRNNHLKSADFFDVEKYGEITFVSKKVTKSDDGFVAVGDLTIHGVTKEVSIPFSLTGPIAAFGDYRLGVEANLVINRHDYGVSWSKALDNGGLVVGNDVKISLEVEGVKAKEGTN